MSAVAIVLFLIEVDFKTPRHLRVIPIFGNRGLQKSVFATLKIGHSKKMHMEMLVFNYTWTE